MTDQMPSQDKNLRKKLQKQEQRILARLQKAQQAQVKASERFRRAEARLQQRIARVQRAEGRLTLVRQQLDELLASPPVGAQFIAPTTAPLKEERAAAEAAEENARLAAARADEVASRQEQAGSRYRLEQEVQQIEAEEEVVETITAVTIAEIAAERAAAAKAFAEASSSYTREARRRAEEAEQALGEVRVAIRGGLLIGEEAEVGLQKAEHEVTRAQAMLADAEAAEEQALTAAVNAEAEAEVAEGMAYATVNRTVTLLEEEQGNREGAEQEASQTYLPQEAVEGEPDITLKIPHVHPEETG
jgi:hypothetical protein